jgi:hypothetical protein
MNTSGNKRTQMENHLGALGFIWFNLGALFNYHTTTLSNYLYFEAKYSRAKEVRESINPSMKIRELALR